MIFKLAWRFLRECGIRKTLKFAYLAGLHGLFAMIAFKRRVKKGDISPPFMFMSITDACNLKCEGCWVTQHNPPNHLSLPQMEKVITYGKQMKTRLHGILGGEPLMHPDLKTLVSSHPECYFQIFTNATLLDDEWAEFFAKQGNVTPLISLEGLEEESDRRRGANKVYNRTMNGLEVCARHGLITGVAASINQRNFSELVNEEFLQTLIRKKVQYMWYYIYRPVGPDPHPDIALTKEQILELRQFMVDMRCKLPLIIVDAYWDHEGNALCPAATGVSHHISPAGAIEPCPPLQATKDYLTADSDLYETVRDSKFLADFRKMVTAETRGCILMDNPHKLEEFLQSENATDSSGRDCFCQELKQAMTCPGHHIPGSEIPEKHWLYKFAKKYWFFGFGAYG